MYKTNDCSFLHTQLCTVAACELAQQCITMNLEQQYSMLSAFVMCIVIAMFSQPGDCQDTTDESMKNAEVLKMKMYKYLRDMALPKAAKDEIVQQRFVMQVRDGCNICNIMQS